MVLPPTLVDGGDVGIAHHVDAALEQLLGQVVAQLFVEAAQDLGAAVEQRGVDAEPAEDAGKLHGDVAAADDDDGLRQLLQMERLVGGDGMAGARHLGHGRSPAGGDQDDARGDLAVAGLQVERVRVGQLRARLQQRDAGPLQALLVEPLEARDLGVLAGDQARPVEARRRDAPAEAGRVLELVAEAAGVDQQLLGHAAADHAGAAEAILLRDRHLGAVPGGDARRPHPARPAADDEEVVVVFAHGSVLTTSRRTKRKGARRGFVCQSIICNNSRSRRRAAPLTAGCPASSAPRAPPARSRGRAACPSAARASWTGA